ncbi:autophagy- protein 2 [Parahypoxylon ruwenzoriense]
MAAFFQAFRSSSMPKRLLRYTLSKLDYFDTDALDTDNLDFAVGRNNVFTLQDKLEQLLQLPPSFEVQKAKVLLLRITVPSAIYTSPITVEVDGIEIKLKLASREDDGTKQTSRHTSHGEKRRSPSGKDDPVPHAIDLAQSFLETQPSKDKAELQAALNAESQDLGASMSSSEDESDEDYTLGTGQPLSLPTFLADFLQGIVDRLQISIKGVTFHLDIEVPVEQNSTVSELVTFQLAIDEINAEGVTTAGDETAAEGLPKMVHKEGKRFVALNKIRASLISEANVFSTLARSPSMPSSLATNSPVVANREVASRESLPTGMSASGWRSHDADLEQSQYHHHPLVDSEDAFNIPYDMSGSSDGRDDESRSTPSTPRALAPQTPPRVGPMPFPSKYPFQSFIEPRQDPSVSLMETAQSEPALRHRREWGEDSVQPTTNSEDLPLDSSRSDGTTASLGEELAQSHLFSHEEAESMYMSAFSNAASSQVGRTSQTMPGAWDSEPSSTEGSPNSKRGARPPLRVPLELETTMPQEIAADGHPSPLNAGSSSDSNAKQNPVVDNLEEARQPHDSRPYHVEKGDAPAEDASTPRGPTRLVKELVSLSAISLYIPSNHQHIRVAPAEDVPVPGAPRGRLDRSVSRNLPGAFSIYAGEQSTASITPVASMQGPETLDNTLEIVLSSLQIQSDLSTGFLLVMVVSRILSALKEQPESTHRQTAKAEIKNTPSFMPDVKIVAEQISINFLENLIGIADTPERLFHPSPVSLNSDALLTAVIQNLSVGLSGSSSSTETSVDVGKFKLGYGNDDIISFDQRIQMRASVNDAFPSVGADISLKVAQWPAITRYEVKTLPLHVKLDLQRLDETFSWFGGLSGFLNMSSSMTSSSAPTPKSPVGTPRKQRGVRFDAPIRPDDTSASSENKVNMRLGGFHLDLVGKECSVSLDTSAVKLVIREEGVGIGISKIHLAGPYMRNSMGDPPIRAVITNTRLDYRATPNDVDLERLLDLIIPSKHKFDQNDDEIMVDTLLRQRRNGPVLRVNVDDVEINIGRIQHLEVLPALGEEVARLSTVTKYLPEDDRPGILTLALVHNLDVAVDVGGKFGSVQASVKDTEIGHISIPSLVALGIGSISIRRNHTEELVGTAISSVEKASQGPVLTMRAIGEEMEPVIKLRMRNLNIEYRVPTIMDILGLAEDTTPQDFEATLAASVANLGEHAHAAITGKPQNRSSSLDKGKGEEGKPTKVDFVLRDCLLGLNPLGLPSKLVIVLTDARFEIALSNGDDARALGHLNRASILLIDDVSMLGSKAFSSTARRRSSNTSTPQVVELCQQGYVDICYISSAKATIHVGANHQDGTKWVDVELRDDLLVLETCADSTQTLIALANALAPPTPPSKEIKYRTNIVPVEDLLASISADAFGKAEGDYDFDNDFGLAQELSGDDDGDFEFGDSGQSSPLAVDSRYYDESSIEAELADAVDSMGSEKTTTQDTNDGVLLTNFSSQQDILDDDDELVIHENYFGSGSVIQGTAHRWNSTKNAYDEENDAKVQRSPLSVRVRDVHVIWNLFDGYDWNRTRDVISKAVYDIEATAIERQSRHGRIRPDTDLDIVEEETVIGDFLFNSIYIGIPANRDPRELAQAINQELNDAATETESIATTAMTATASRQGSAYRAKKRLKLNRSKRHKITFELKGINVDLVTFPPDSGETQSSIDVRVKDLDIFDHVPTSTWKKFATYDQDAGEREMGTSMVHLEILSVKPVAELAASEIVLKATVLPLRLHVDQDALDFITRFFEFKDDSAPAHASPSDVPFVQRAEVNSIPVNLDFKPKRVDYAGLRSGHTTEFMNFLVLDQARMVLRHTIIYGVSGFDRLGKTLNDIWMPDVKRTQLPGVLAGLAPIRSLANVGSGFRNLVEIPIREYKKDGRIVRSISKGAVAFAKTTGTEIVKLGAKLAVGTQYALQGAEGILVKQPASHEITGWDDEELDNEEPKQISLYADQPTGVVQGLRGAYSSLARDLNMARDAIIAVPGEVMESQSAQGAAKAVLRRAPTIIFRPLIGSSKAIGQTLMGATNALDPQNRRRVEEKYKRH